MARQHGMRVPRSIPKWCERKSAPSNWCSGCRPISSRAWRTSMSQVRAIEILLRKVVPDSDRGRGQGRRHPPLRCATARRARQGGLAAQVRQRPDRRPEHGSQNPGKSTQNMEASLEPIERIIWSPGGNWAQWALLRVYRVRGVLRRRARRRQDRRHARRMDGAPPTSTASLLSA